VGELEWNTPATQHFGYPLPEATEPQLKQPLRKHKVQIARRNTVHASAPYLSGYGLIPPQVLTHFVFSTCYERRRCFLKAACAMDARQERATKRTSRRFSRRLISAYGRGDSVMPRPRARRLRDDTADLNGGQEMNERVKGRLSRTSPTRFGKAALLYDQWGAEPKE
jgi:hypothetical protein